MMRSPCCNARVRVEGKMNYITGDRRNSWYACTACGQPCDPVEDQHAANVRLTNEWDKLRHEQEKGASK